MRHLPRPAVTALALLALAAAPAAAQAPAATGTVLARLRELGDFGTFVAALERTGIAARLDGAGPFTIYAVSDAGFARIPADTLAALEADPARFARVIGHHVLPSRLTGMDMMNLPIYARVATLAGDSMTVYHDKGGIKVDLSLVKTADAEAANGVIHTVHKVILVP